MGHSSNASHTVKVVENICRDTDVAASLDTLQLTLSTLRTFAGDETRLASLLEVPDVGMILIKLLRFAVENRLVLIEQEFMETLIRLLSLTRVAWEQLPNTLDPPIPPIKLYEWGSQVQTDYQDDLLRVIQVFACLGKQRHSQWIYDLGSYSHFTNYASVWNGSSQPPNDLVEIHALQERSLAISHDGSHIAVGDGNEITSIDIIAEPHFEVRGTNAGEPREPIYSLRLSDDLQTLASRHDDGWIKIWRRQRDQWRVSKRCRGKGLGLPPYDLAFSKDGSRLAFWSLKGLKVWNLADDSLIALEESQELACSLSWVPSGESIVTGTMYGRVKIWSVNQRKTIHTFKAHRNRIECLALRHDGKLLATGGYDERIRVWKCSNWEKVWDFNIGERVSSLAFSPDGKRLVSGGAKGALHLWNVDIGDNEGMEYSLIE
ncbi:hypothetical protein ONZ45_g14573 [Pleurotus djamor]|nr:hypothetical protein ONZ45_g14573 [Pleurotus djamor]